MQKMSCMRILEGGIVGKKKWQEKETIFHNVVGSVFPTHVGMNRRAKPFCYEG